MGLSVGRPSAWAMGEETVVGGEEDEGVGGGAGERGKEGKG